MKDFEKISTQEVITEVTRDVLRRKRSLLGTAQLHPGQFLWELDTKTLEVQKAKVDEIEVRWDGTLLKKVDAKDGFLYCVAINKENAIRKFIKICKHITLRVNGSNSGSI